MRRLLRWTVVAGAALSIMAGSAHAQARTVRLTHAELKDKIRGGWAGQTIGVTFGGPTEFRYNGTMINDHIPIRWYDGYLKETYEKNPGLYDDLYVDLTFVDVLEKKGLDARAQDFADALANAGYMLWHANQIARYNVLNGIKPPASGHWLNNPEADAIDFEIESDFIGLMTPGMPGVAAVFADTVGHIMNYGDGWYGGVFIATMYSLAFTSSDVDYVVREALKAIPAQSTSIDTAKAARATGRAGRSPRSPDASNAPRTPPAVPAAIAIRTPSGRMSSVHGIGITSCDQAHCAAKPAVPATRPASAPKRSARLVPSASASPSIASASTRYSGSIGVVSPISGPTNTLTPPRTRV